MKNVTGQSFIPNNETGIISCFRHWNKETENTLFYYYATSSYAESINNNNAHSQTLQGFDYNANNWVLMFVFLFAFWGRRVGVDMNSNAYEYSYIKCPERVAIGSIRAHRPGATVPSASLLIQPYLCHRFSLLHKYTRNIFRRITKFFRPVEIICKQL